MGYDNGSGFAPAIEFDGLRVFHGDCREVLKSLPDCSVDSIVTDPPYGLSNTTPELVSKTIVRWISGDRDFIPTGAGFMGKEWDSFVPPPAVWDECLRVLKPGGHLLAFFGSRTMDLGQLAIRLAGFELRDSIAWIYGSGFPKSLDVSKAIDKRLGAEREIVGTAIRQNSRFAVSGSGVLQPQYADGSEYGVTGEPVTPEAQKWQGWGTALKPAFEPIVVGRKPLVGTVAENVLEWGTGGLNIDGSRIGTEKRENALRGPASGSGNYVHGKRWDSGQSVTVHGRWPANVILDEHTAELLDQQSGQAGGGFGVRGKGGQTYANGKGFANTLGETGQTVGYGDSGGASRFFYVAKASKRDRNEGLDGLDERNLSDRGADGMRDKNSIVTRHTVTKNFHPTVKPTQLMRYLIKLVTPPGGTVLDPFTGSGSTGKAAILDGFEFVGAELTEDYLPIIEGRLKWALENRETDETLF